LLLSIGARALTGAVFAQVTASNDTSTIDGTNNKAYFAADKNELP
jgi:hypothetical protein